MICQANHVRGRWKNLKISVRSVAKPAESIFYFAANFAATASQLTTFHHALT